MIEHVLEGCQCEGKRCTKCEEVRCVGLFNKHKIGAGGLHAACRACSSASNKAYYQKKRERIMAKHRAWRNSHPEYHRQYYQEHTDTLNMQRQDYYREHAEEISNQKKAYYREHAVEILELRKEYQKTHPEQISRRRKRRYQEHAEQFKAEKRISYQKKREQIRERKRNHRKAHPHLYADIDKAKEAKRRACETQAGGSYTPQQWRELKLRYNYTCLCCGRQEPEIKLTADHVIPITKHGSSDISNIQPLCYSCNSKKHNKIIDYRIGKDHHNGE